MTKQELQLRTKQFSVRIIKLAKSLQGDSIDLTIARQILRSGTSVGANYRAACLAKSTKDFINKLKIVEEELDETIFWMELLVEAEIVKENKIEQLKNESEQLFKIISRSIKTTKERFTQNTKTISNSVNSKSVNP